MLTYIYTQLDAPIHDYIYQKQKQKISKLCNLISIYFIFIYRIIPFTFIPTNLDIYTLFLKIPVNTW